MTPTLQAEHTHAVHHAAALADSPVLVEVVRGDLLECQHRGRLVVTSPDGSIRASAGDVESPFYPRSSLKPMQALAMLAHGLDVEGAELAMAAASHGGEQIHRDATARILAGAGLGLDALQNTPDLPLLASARDEWIGAGHGAEPVAQNCSGKHAAMLRTCVRAGWPIDTYLDAGHPLQQAVRDAVVEWCGSASEATTDGCGAPLFAVSPAGLARAFGAIAAASDGDARRLADAYRNHPEYVSNTASPERRLHQAVPGLVVKGGAEGCLAIGLADGTGIVVKSDDGSHRGLMAVAVEVLTRLGVADDPAVAQALAGVPDDRVLGHGHPVGVVRARLDSIPALR